MERDLNVPIPDTAHSIVRTVASRGGRALVVGGSVRDAARGSASKDVDLEVYGLSPEDLRETLENAGFRVGLVGQSFAVLKVRDESGAAVDVNLPRRESKSGRGHRGFDVEADPWLPVEVALRRRDFTFNAMAWDPLTGELVDPYGGLEDLQAGRLRATSEAFVEDPLRVLRGMQMAARFDLRLDPGTREMCRRMRDEYGELSIERVWTEWEKWARLATRPSRGLELLRETGWVGAYPALESLIGCPQEPEWHPEGDVWTHTLLVCDAASRIADRESLEPGRRVELLLAAAAHDLGKPETTVRDEEGRVRSPGHTQSVETVEGWLSRIGCPLRLHAPVLALVRRHLDHLGFVGSARHVRRLSRDLGESGTTIEQLVHLIEADAEGRPPLAGGLPEQARELWRVAQEVRAAEAAPAPILMGRHLLDLGFEPGPELGRWLALAYDAQLDGEFEDLEGALRWVRRRAGGSGQD
jgi:tRNA nucleotidyltransferase (CCA-adding enzyme)